MAQLAESGFQRQTRSVVRCTALNGAQKRLGNLPNRPTAYISPAPFGLRSVLHYPMKGQGPLCQKVGGAVDIVRLPVTVTTLRLKAQVGDPQIVHAQAVRFFQRHPQERRDEQPQCTAVGHCRNVLVQVFALQFLDELCETFRHLTWQLPQAPER